MYKLYIAVCLLIFASSSCFAQWQCAHEEAMESLYADMNHEQLTKFHESNSRIIQLANKEVERRKNSKEKEILATITVPVVWHVLVDEDNPNGPTNVSISQIQQEMTLINQWYSGTNEYYNSVSDYWLDRVATPNDLNVNFVLASSDENGHATHGVTYRRTNIAKEGGCGENDIPLTSQGGIDAWSQGDYINVWICPITHAAGYGFYPGSQKASNMYFKDGIVVNADYVGGRGGSIMAHELGHYFGLPHTFSGCSVEGDGIDDTPDSGINNIAYVGEGYKWCPGYPDDTVTDNDFQQCGKKIMVQNCMDYSIDQCKTSFTKGQAAVMRSWLLDSDPDSPRGLLRTSNGLNPGDGTPPSDYYYGTNGDDSGDNGGDDGSDNGGDNEGTGGDNGGNDSFSQTLIDGHNNIRNNVNTPPETPLNPLSWSSSLAAEAEAWASVCSFSFDNAPYGKNLVYSSGDQSSSSAAISLAISAMENSNLWTKAKPYYHISYDQSSGATTASCSIDSCSSYVSIINEDTTSLGCGIKYCGTTGSPFTDGRPWTVMFCYYDPPNYVGQPAYKACSSASCEEGSSSCTSTGCVEGDCGIIIDNCGNEVDCGVCCDEEPCVQNACGDFVACGSPVSCGNCETGLACVNDGGVNVCVDQIDCHANECTSNGIECGNREYCGVNNPCGYCEDSQECDANGHCVPLQCDNCGGEGRLCDNGVCTCDTGYHEEGGVCVINSAGFDYSTVMEQVIPPDGYSFSVSGNAIQLNDPSGQNLLNWVNSASVVDKYTTRTQATVSVSSGTFGIAVRTGQNTGANDRIQWEIRNIGSNPIVYCNLIYYGSNNYFGGYPLDFPVENAQVTVIMGFIEDSNEIRTELQIAGFAPKAFRFSQNYYPALGSISYYFEDNSGVPVLTEAFLGTSTTLTVTFTDCIDDAEWEEYFYLLTGAVRETTSVQVRDSGENGNCNKKSATTGKALVSGLTTVITSSSVSSAGLATKLIGTAGTPLAASVGFQSAAVVPGAAGAQIAGFPISAAGAVSTGGVAAGGGGGGAGGLGGGAVAGIVVGSVGGAVLIAGVVVVVVAAAVAGKTAMSNDNSGESNHQVADEPPKKRGSIRMTLVGMFSGPRGGVDVMNDPKGHQSISARSPEVK